MTPRAAEPGLDQPLRISPGAVVERLWRQEPNQPLRISPGAAVGHLWRLGPGQPLRISPGAAAGRPSRLGPDRPLRISPGAVVGHPWWQGTQLAALQAQRVGVRAQGASRAPAV